MKLTHLIVSRLGPYYFETTIEIEPDVTILTGANDTGKSSTLRILQLFLERKNAGEMDVNQDHLQESGSVWSEDNTMRCALRFRVNHKDPIEATWRSGLDLADYMLISKEMTRGSPHTFAAHTKKFGVQGWQIPFPDVVVAPSTDSVREKIDLTTPNQLEKALLNVGFGGKYNFESLNARSDINFSRALDEAEERINRELEKAMPVPSSLRIRFSQIAGNRKFIAVFLRDRHDAMTPFGIRGTGVRKMVTLLAELLTRSVNAGHRIIIIDEPETSLHADAQHLLREFLFGLTTAGNTQVAEEKPCA